MKPSHQTHKRPAVDEGVGTGGHDLLAEMREANRSVHVLASQLLSMGITESGDGVEDNQLLGGAI